MQGKAIKICVKYIIAEYTNKRDEKTQSMKTCRRTYPVKLGTLLSPS